MVYAVVALAVIGFGFAGTAIGLAVSRSGDREKLAHRERDLVDERRQKKLIAEELHDTREAMGKENEYLRERLADLREAVYALPDNPGNRHRLLSHLDELLQAEEADDGSSD